MERMRYPNLSRSLTPHKVKEPYLETPAKWILAKRLRCSCLWCHVFKKGEMWVVSFFYAKVRYWKRVSPQGGDDLHLSRTSRMEEQTMILLPIANAPAIPNFEER